MAAVQSFPGQRQDIAEMTLRHLNRTDPYLLVCRDGNGVIATRRVWLLVVLSVHEAWNAPVPVPDPVLVVDRNRDGGEWI